MWSQLYSSEKWLIKIHLLPLISKISTPCTGGMKEDAETNQTSVEDITDDSDYLKTKKATQKKDIQSSQHYTIHR